MMESINNLTFGHPSWHSYSLLGICLAGYLLIVRYLRYRRKSDIEAPFVKGNRPLSSMTTEEAYEIMMQLQELEFPYAFAKARKIALLKAGGIPTMSKLFAVTGQNAKRNAGRRSVDTEVLLRESQSKRRDSERYAMAVARVNYLHSRYRRAAKITDPDLLHTLGDGLAEILNVVNREEWRKLTDVEVCAAGVFHKNLGEDMEIPFTPLPSSVEGWKDGLHFARELRDWTVRYEEDVAMATPTNDQYVRVYVDSAVATLPGVVRTTLRKVLADNLDDVMRTSLCLEAPGPILSSLLAIVRNIRIVFLRYAALPRPSSLPVKMVDDLPNPKTGLYNFERKTLQPWYVRPTFWSIWGPGAFLIKLLGGRLPGSGGDRYIPQGYDLMTIGPEPQNGKGSEDMIANVQIIRGKGVATCPFSQAKGGAF
ncbi:uncharacterized protein F4817DRAFT_322738 [Daldinia loculata]|uniref:uncharacterized protein n=1 Tax=Daldinia loculata TaxID=103429 RepID=UPI0020C51309|nr:uncharacterized protein F4817DRAFT_322738 [Daldinia loculata]KAI1652284.1 hypothetical protein F4817DRAFT_322738 [Daldinia loculata]